LCIGFIAALLAIQAGHAAPADEPRIGYPTVDAALAALMARKDVLVTQKDGWTIVQDDANRTLWSFTPPGHPAYPAVVKRALVNKEGGTAIELNALCQADKATCDKLIEDFRTLDDKVRQSVRDKVAAPAPSGNASTPPEAAAMPKELNPNAYVADGAARDMEVEALTLNYLSLRDGQKYAEAYALLGARLQQMAPLEKWTAAFTRFNARAGAVVSHRIKRVTWYKDPPGNPPGTYAAADFVGEYANVPFHCGYVVWFQDAGAFRLIREEENVIDAAMQKRLSPNELVNLRRKFGC
jgi:hypothetical protein